MDPPMKEEIPILIGNFMQFSFRTNFERSCMNDYEMDSHIIGNLLVFANESISNTFYNILKAQVASL